MTINTVANHPEFVNRAMQRWGGDFSQPHCLSRAMDVEVSDTLTIDIDGWEGPLDLLLTLARNQKVDLRAISILDLVDQYIAFMNEARELKLELAADYLVMAAWLAYLK